MNNSLRWFIVLALFLVAGSGALVLDIQQQRVPVPTFSPTVARPTPTPRPGEFSLFSGVSVTLTNSVTGERITLTNNGPEGLEIHDGGKAYTSALEYYTGCEDCPLWPAAVDSRTWPTAIRVDRYEFGKGRPLYLYPSPPWRKE